MATIVEYNKVPTFSGARSSQSRSKLRSHDNNRISSLQEAQDQVGAENSV